MKKLLITLALVAASATMFAQDYYGFTRDINGYSRRYNDNQIVTLYQNHYGIPQATLIQLYDGYGRNWGNVTLGLEFSHLFGVSIWDVMDVYRGYPNGQGWGVMAKRYGIKPGSREFHRMKAMMKNKNKYWKGIYTDYGRGYDPMIARRNRVIFNDAMIMYPSNRDINRIHKNIEKENREIYRENQKINREIYKENQKIARKNKKAARKYEKEMRKARRYY